MDSDQTERREPSHGLSGGPIRVGFGLEALGRACLARPRLSAALLTVLVLVAAAGTTRLAFDDEIYNLYRTGSPHYRDYAELLRLFPTVANQVVVVFEGDDVATRAGLEALRDIHLELQFLDGVAGAVSIFSAREATAGDGPPEAVLPADLPEGAALDALLERVGSHPLVGDRLIAPDHRATLMVVAIDPAADPFTTAEAVVATIDRMLAEEAADLDLESLATGSPLVQREILHAIQRDQIVLNAAGTVIAISLCLLYFGRWRVALIAALPGMVGVVLTLGGFGIVGQSINAITNVLPTLVLVIAFADSLHMTNAVRNALAEGRSGPEAARTAVDEVGPACAMTSITTSLVFLTLALSPSSTISDFGIAGAWAAAVAFVAVISVVPVGAALLLTSADAPRTGTVDGVLARLNTRAAEAACRLVKSRPAAVAAAGTLCIGIATVGYFAVEPRYGYRDFLPDRSDTNAAIELIDAAFGGADSVNILVRRTDRASGSLAGADAVRAAHFAAEGTPPLTDVFSIKSIEDWLHRDMSDLGGQGAEAGEFGIPEHLAARLKSPDEPAWLVTAFLPALDASQSRPIFDALDAALAPVRIAAPGYDFIVTGLVPMTAYGSGDLIETLNLSLFGSVAVTVLLIAVTFRSALIGFLAALPNILPLAVAGSFLYLSGIGLQITGVIALTVAFGLAVDDTIHLIHRWRIETASGDGPSAVIRALSRVGPVIIATTIVLIAGTVATTVSDLALVRLFGGLCILIFAAALVGDLILMPALLIVFVGRRRSSSRE